MTGETIRGQAQGEACANCGAAMQGDFCARCGQSREDIKRPVWSLATDTLDGLFAWDGRLLTTFRQLFTRPGRVARDYMDGRRQSFTPPVRLYLVVSLIFFAAMTVSGIRIVAVEVSVENGNDSSVFVTLFQPPRDEALPVLSPEEQAEVIDYLNSENITGHWETIAVRAMNDPELLESQTAAASSQAMILMVVIFALLCAVLHPRRRIIEHAVYALYFHAALLLPFAAVVIVGVHTDPPLWAAIAILVASVVSLNGGVALYDRGFYGSSWFGAILRSIAICMAYVTLSVVVALGLIYVSAL